MGCPAKYAAGVDGLWFACHAEWRFWEQNPVQRGLLAADELDPRYWRAVEVIEWAAQKYRPKG